MENKTHKRPSKTALQTLLISRFPNSGKDFSSLWISDTPNRYGEFDVNYQTQWYDYRTFLAEFDLTNDEISKVEYDAKARLDKSMYGINELKKQCIGMIQYSTSDAFNYSQLLFLMEKCQVSYEYLIQIAKPLYFFGNEKGEKQGNYKRWIGKGGKKEIFIESAPNIDLGIKYITRHKYNGHNKPWGRTVYNYLYGHENAFTKEQYLSENTVAVAKLEGEPDVIAFNAIFRPFGIVGVTMGGVGSWNHESEQLKHIKKLAPNAVFLSIFDVDLAGENASKAQNSDTVVIDWQDVFPTMDLVKGFDVCNAVCVHGGKEMLFNAVMHAIEKAKTAVQVVEKQVVAPENETPVSIVNYKENDNGFVHYNHVQVAKYLDEFRTPLLKLIRMSGRLCLHGHPELGKTTFVKNLAYDDESLRILGVKRVIFVTERVILVKEVANSTGAIIARGKSFKEKDCLMDGERLIAVNSDNVMKIKNLLNDSLLVCDEFDKWTTDAGYRDAHNLLIECFEDAPFVLLMSATPDRKVAKHLNFNYIQCSSAYRMENKKFFFRYVATDNYQTAYISNIKSNLSKRHIVFHDSKAKLEISKTELEKMNLKCVIISRDELNDNASEFNTNGGLNGLGKYDVILCTSIADAGIDIRCKIDSVHLQFNMPIRSAVQAMQRGRGEVNLETDVFCYHSEKTPIEGAAQLTDFGAKINIALNDCKGLDMLSKCRNIRDIAENLQGSLQKMSYYSEKHGKFCVNVPYCSFLSEKKPTSISEHTQALQDLDAAIYIVDDAIEIDSEVKDAVKLAVGKRTDFNAECRKMARAFIQTSLGNAIDYASEHAPKPKDGQKESIKTMCVKYIKNKPFDGQRFEPCEDKKNECEKHVYEGYLTATNTIIFAWLKRFFEISKYVKGYDSTHFVTFSDDVYKIEIRRLVTQLRETKETARLSAKDEKAKERSAKLSKELSEHRNKTLTKVQLKQIVSKIYPIVTGSEWLSYTSSVNRIVESKDGFTIGNQWTLDAAVKSLNGILLTANDLNAFLDAPKTFNEICEHFSDEKETTIRTLLAAFPHETMYTFEGLRSIKGIQELKKETHSKSEVRLMIKELVENGTIQKDTYYVKLNT